MKLKKLRIENFRGYKDVTINFSDFNCIVGKNDVGKSTIFKALEKFFEYRSDIDEYDYNEIIDKTVHNNKEEYTVYITATIECCDDTLKPLIENGIVPGFLTIRKKYYTSPTSGKFKYQFGIIVKESIFGNKKYSDIVGDGGKIKQAFELSPLLRIKKDKKDNQNATIEMNYNDKTKENEIIIPVSELRPFELSKLFDTLPKFKFLTSETPLAEIQELYIKEILADQFNNLTTMINDLPFSGNNDLHFSNNSITINNNIMTTVGENALAKNIPLSNRGEGFQLKIRNKIFQELAKRDTNGNIIFAFEEPESHLHPEAQVEAYETLKELSRTYQVMFTTHSPTIVSLCNKEEIIQVVNDKTDKIKQGKNITYENVIEDLGISPDSELITRIGIAECYIFVEGKHDIPFIKHILKLYGKEHEHSFAFIPMGSGDNVKLWVNWHLVDALKKPYIFIIDSDNKRVDKLNSYNYISSKNIHITRKREFENYILPNSLECIPSLSLRHNCLHKYHSVWDSIDVPLVLFVERERINMPNISFERVNVKNHTRKNVKNASDDIKDLINKYFFEVGNARKEDLDFSYFDSAGVEHDEFWEIYQKIEDLCK